jgi:hypothetical protein
MHDVHRPHFVDRQWHSQRIGFIKLEASIRFNSQIKLQLSINTVNTLVLPEAVLHITPGQKAQPKAPIALIMGQFQQPVSDHGVLMIQLDLIAVTGFTDTINLTGQTNVDVLLPHRLLSQCSPLLGLDHFFSRAS